VQVCDDMSDTKWLTLQGWSLLPHQKHWTLLKFKILTGILPRTQVFGNVILCRWVSSFWHFEGRVFLTSRIKQPKVRYWLFNFNLFLFVRSRRGLWPTGYRTCQFHLTPSIYIKIHYNTYKQPEIKKKKQYSHCRISGSQKVNRYLLIQTYISVMEFYNMLLFKINLLINNYQDETLRHKRIAEQQ
jgi:hypothetical protein